MNSDFLEDYLKPEELAKRLHLAPITLAKWRSAKKGPPYVKVGRHILYSPDGVKRWLLTRQTKQSA